MLGISKRKCKMDTPVHINGNEKKKKTEYRNSYITYLNIQNVIPMCCLLVFGGMAMDGITYLNKS